MHLGTYKRRIKSIFASNSVVAYRQQYTVTPPAFIRRPTAIRLQTTTYTHTVEPCLYNIQQHYNALSIQAAIMIRLHHTLCLIFSRRAHLLSHTRRPYTPHSSYHTCVDLPWTNPYHAPVITPCLTPRTRLSSLSRMQITSLHRRRR